MKTILMSAVLLACSAPCFAADESVTRQDIAQIVSGQTLIRKDIQSGKGVWAERPQAERDAVLLQQDQVFALVQGKQSIAELDAPDRLEVANLLESINATVERVEADRQVCTRERKIGSNFTTRVCRSLADARRLREMTQDAIRKRPLPPATPGQR